MNEWCPEWDPGLAPSAELAELAQLLPWNRRLQADYTRPRRWRSGNGCPLPQRGSEYQPRVQSWGPVCKMRSILKERRIFQNNQTAREGVMRRSFRTHRFVLGPTQGFTLGWYVAPRWGFQHAERTDSFRGIPRVLN